MKKGKKRTRKKERKEGDRGYPGRSTRMEWDQNGVG